MDVGTTKRRSMTPARKLRIFEENKGICVNCSLPIKAGDAWFVEHKRALELGGEDTDENCGPAHTSCKRDKDADDHHRAAKAKRVKQRHLNIRTAPAKPIRSAPFPKSAKAERRQTKQPLPPRLLFQEAKS